MGFLLYSTQSVLADRIFTRYFGNRFYVYCAEAFDPSVQPGSSNPAKLYESFRAIAEQGDRGHPKYTDHKLKLKAVAERKYLDKEITETVYNSLVWEIEHCETRDFLPIVYLILRPAVAKKLVEVPVNRRASLSSEEFTIVDLLPEEFECLRANLRVSGGL